MVEQPTWVEHIADGGAQGRGQARRGHGRGSAGQRGNGQRAGGGCAVAAVAGRDVVGVVGDRGGEQPGDPLVVAGGQVSGGSDRPGQPGESLAAVAALVDPVAMLLN